MRNFVLHMYKVLTKVTDKIFVVSISWNEKKKLGRLPFLFKYQYQYDSFVIQ